MYGISQEGVYRARRACCPKLGPSRQIINGHYAARKNIAMGMGILFNPIGDPSWPSRSDELVPALDVDDRELCRTCLTDELDGGDVLGSCLFFGSFEGVERGGLLWGGRGTPRLREPKTLLRGEKSAIVRGGSTAMEPSVLVDQRLRKRSSEVGEFGKGDEEKGSFEKDVKDEVESTEDRGASESVLERGSVTSPCIPAKMVSGIAGGSGRVVAESVYVKEG